MTNIKDAELKGEIQVYGGYVPILSFPLNFLSSSYSSRSFVFAVRSSTTTFSMPFESSGTQTAKLYG